MVIDELSGIKKEWKDVIADQISLQDVSGHGGNRTFKVTRTVNENVVGQVAIHMIGESNNFRNQPDLLNVQTSASLAFSNAGLCPKRISQNTDKFFIDEVTAHLKIFHTFISAKLHVLMGDNNIG